VDRLTAWVIEDPTRLVVAGVGYRRGEPYEPTVYWDDEETGLATAPLDMPETLFKVDRMGKPNMLVARKVFEQLSRPWFAYDYSHADDNKWPGPDIWFSELCKKHGIDMWVDPSVISPHLMEGWIDHNTWKSYVATHQEAMNGNQVIKKVAHSDIGVAESRDEADVA